MISLFKLIFRSLVHYKQAHLSVIIGTAISTMVLIGTLIVGDSVETSLENTTNLRLGNTAYTFSGIDRFFRSTLANEVRNAINSEVAPIMLINGIASSQGGAYQANNIEVLGIDDHFRAMIPGESTLTVPGNNEALISENLAGRLQLKTGDSFLLKLEKASLIPKNAPFVSDADNQISLRLKVVNILGPEKLGRFNLKTSQTAPFNIFLSMSFLNDKMGTPGKANKLLIKDTPGLDGFTISTTIRDNWKPEDLGLYINRTRNGDQWEIRSERVFIDSLVSESVSAIDPQAAYILTYFVNSFRKGDNHSPYSFISAGPFENPESEFREDEILINQWLGEDLGVHIGDSIEISYFTIGPLRRLEEVSRWFKIKRVVPISGIYADQDLMPALPGLTDAGNCREWETGIPIDLELIRDKDEEYWNNYKGTPKAFISYPDGKKLWENRFGVCTSIRLSAERHSKSDIENNLSMSLDPGRFGFTVKSVKEDGLTAAHGGVDFAELFMGLSFFLLVAGLSLMALLYNLHLDKRMSQVGTLKAIGYPDKLVQRLVLVEGLLVAIPGVILGAFLAIAYNKVIFAALNTVWFEIVRTSVLQEDIRLNSIISGVIISTVLVSIIIWFNTWRKLRTRPAKLQRSVQERKSGRTLQLINYSGWITGIIAISLLAYDFALGETLNAAIFFSAGGLLLLSLLLLSSAKLRNFRTGISRDLSLISLVRNNLVLNNKRSIRIIILFAIGTFVIVSTGLNKKDLHSGSEDKQSGTGGFLLFGETTLPVLLDLNDPRGKEHYGLEQNLNFIQMRKSDGDDASCLNLNRISQPRILGIDPFKLEGRYSFIKSTPDLDQKDPWSSLTKKLPGGVVPAIADQTVIQWGLGMTVGDTLVYRNELGQELKLKLIGGLANSIFQGNILIDENHFLDHFPSNSGSHVFLVDGKDENMDKVMNELERSFRNEGLELDIAADRLAAFNEVENTYLSIFLILGGLAMILGTIGLGISLARNILDRQNELAILRAVGFKNNTILNMLTTEHMILLGIGTIIGALTAFIATMPAILSAFVDASWQTASLIIFIILLNGLIWILLITKNNLKKELLFSLRTE
ncbi:ABC transporter permease [Bacteroidota bacterium]